jgi:hypothetical protein
MGTSIEQKALDRRIKSVYGRCEKCPGWTKVAELRKGNEVDEALDGNQTVFCVHWCHKIAREV